MTNLALILYGLFSTPFFKQVNQIRVFWRIGNTKECENLGSGRTDSREMGCTSYDEKTSDCGEYDDDDFTARTMCCACKGSCILSSYINYSELGTEFNKVYK